MAKPQLLMSRPSLADLPPTPELPDGYTISACTADDACELARMLAAAFEDASWTVERVNQALLKADDVLVTFAVRVGETIVATASLRDMPEYFPGDAYLHWVGVDPAYRGHRLGSAVSLAVLYEGRKKGCPAAWLETDDFRLPAIKSYLDLGFVPVIKDEALGLRWDVVLRQMKVPISPSA
ncbi:MAG TPA: GNAT family N-acetyltransferase [Capsulimonadaceae bacterium]